MKRRSFFASIAALAVVPSFLKAKPKSEFPLISNKDFFLPPSLLRDPLLADGHLFLRKDDMVIYSMNGGTRPGDTIATDVLGLLYVCERNHGWSPVHSSPVKDVECYKYVVKQLQAPKTICGVAVIEIKGKYRIYKPWHEAILIQFKPVVSYYREA